MQIRLSFFSALFLLLSGCGKGGFPGAIVPPAKVAVLPAPVKQPLVESKPPAGTESPVDEPKPVADIPSELMVQLKELGARISNKIEGHGIDIRNKADFSNRDIDLIAKCPQLVDLTLENVPISDDGLQKLDGLPLTRLILNGCPITSEGIKTLAGLSLRDTLLSIGLRGTKVTDADMTTMQNFTHLQRLDVSKTAVTDAGLPALQTLPLQVLRAAETKVTDAGVKQLHQKLPALVVER